MKPQIVVYGNEGFHNQDPNTRERIEKSKSYQDLSTICIVPSTGMIPAKIVQSWMGLMTPMNQKFVRIFALGMEVGAAYSDAIEMVLNHPDLSQWKYVLTLEHDNAVPPDGLLKLYENMDKYDVIGGIYWTKGTGGQPMCYGNSNTLPVNFIPWLPGQDQVAQCRGLGMGFTLFKLSIFKDKRLPRPLFKTTQSYSPQEGTKVYTQDLRFFEDAGKLGYKFACDTRVKVGHYDIENDMMW